jgi:hypothetical protein
MIRFLTVFTVLLVCFGCLRNRVFIEHDYKYSLGFNDYKTYTFVECQRDTNYICEDVQQAIKQQMAARGYVFSYDKPDLLVNFFVYYDPIKYTGYDQPNINFWLNNNNENDTYKPVRYSLKQGTLMISLIEGTTSEIVWRGYATGIFNDNSHKKSYFKNIVANIFTEYPLFATDAAYKKTKLNKSL